MLNYLSNNKTKFIFPIFLLLLMLFSMFSRVSDEEILKAREAVSEGALIVDVRTPKEFQARHAQEAINLPIEEIMKNNINLPKDKELVLYCRTGSRSSVASKYFREKGWKVYDVSTQADWERKIEVKD